MATGDVILEVSNCRVAANHSVVLSGTQQSQETKFDSGTVDTGAVSAVSAVFDYVKSATGAIPTPFDGSKRYTITVTED